MVADAAALYAAGDDDPLLSSDFTMKGDFNESANSSSSNLEVKGSITRIGANLRSLTELGSSASWRRVRRLNLSLNDIGVRALREIGEISSLESLDLRHNRILALSDLTPLKKCTRLREVWLQNNPFCALPGWRSRVATVLPQIYTIDGTSVQSLPRHVTTADREEVAPSRSVSGDAVTPSDIEQEIEQRVRERVAEATKTLCDRLGEEEKTPKQAKQVETQTSNDDRRSIPKENANCDENNSRIEAILTRARQLRSLTSRSDSSVQTQCLAEHASTQTSLHQRESTSVQTDPSAQPETRESKSDPETIRELNKARSNAHRLRQSYNEQKQQLARAATALRTQSTLLARAQQQLHLLRQKHDSYRESAERTERERESQAKSAQAHLERERNSREEWQKQQWQQQLSLLQQRMQQREQTLEQRHVQELQNLETQLQQVTEQLKNAQHGEHNQLRLQLSELQLEVRARADEAETTQRQSEEARSEAKHLRQQLQHSLQQSRQQTLEIQQLRETVQKLETHNQSCDSAHVAHKPNQNEQRLIKMVRELTEASRQQSDRVSQLIQQRTALQTQLKKAQLLHQRQIQQLHQHFLQAKRKLEQQAHHQRSELQQKFAAQLQQERQQQQQQADETATRECQQLRKQLESLRAELSVNSSMLKAQQQRGDRLQQRSDEARREIEQKRKLWQSEKDELLEQVQAAHDDMSELASEHKALRKRAKKLQDELDAATKFQDEHSQQLEAQLREAQQKLSELRQSLETQKQDSVALIKSHEQRLELTRQDMLRQTRQHVESELAKQRREIARQNEELAKQREELAKQREELSKQRDETDKRREAAVAEMEKQRQLLLQSQKREQRVLAHAKRLQALAQQLGNDNVVLRRQIQLHKRAASVFQAALDSGA